MNRDTIRATTHTGQVIHETTWHYHTEDDTHLRRRLNIRNAIRSHHRRNPETDAARWHLIIEEADKIRQHDLTDAIQHMEDL